MPGKKGIALTPLDIQNPPVIPNVRIGVWNPWKPNLRRCLEIQTPILTYPGRNWINNTFNKSKTIQGRATLKMVLCTTSQMVVPPTIFREQKHTGVISSNMLEPHYYCIQYMNVYTYLEMKYTYNHIHHFFNPYIPQTYILNSPVNHDQ